MAAPAMIPLLPSPLQHHTPAHDYDALSTRPAMRPLLLSPAAQRQAPAPGVLSFPSPTTPQPFARAHRSPSTDSKESTTAGSVASKASCPGNAFNTPSPTKVDAAHRATARALRTVAPASTAKCLRGVQIRRVPGQVRCSAALSQCAQWRLCGMRCCCCHAVHAAHSHFDK